MRIKKIINQSRRDFWAILECEHCNTETGKTSGYDDANFHENVIPEMVCKSCHKKSPPEYRPLSTKYEPNEII